jgi:beta-glucosidase
MDREEIDFATAVELARRGEDIDRVVQNLFRRLTVKERLRLLDGDQPFWSGIKTFVVDGYNRLPIHMGEIKRVGIPGIRFTDGPRGIVMGQSTCFPVSMARGASWDVELEERVGYAIGREGRAQGANLFGGVCVNLPRHPAWGRIQETYSEDPLLLGDFGAAASRGIQRNLMACVKHFAFNSMENARFKVDVECDDAAMHEVYLPHFKKTIDAGGAVAVMSAYNSCNGEFCGQNNPLLTDILREQWGFTGIVISDFIFGLRDPVLSLKNGLDLECPFAQQRAKILPSALKRGQITQDEVDRSGIRLLTQQIKHMVRRDTEEPGNDVVFCKEHRALAREVSARSMVLLRNEPVQSQDLPLLPLDATKIAKCALIGRLAALNNTGDHGSSDVRCPEITSAQQGIKQAIESHGGQVLLEASSKIDAAVAAAKQSDVAILIVGSTAADEGENLSSGSFVPNLPWPSLKELLFDILPTVWHGITKRPTTGSAIVEANISGSGGDRASLRLKDEEVEMIKAVSQANPRTIVVLVGAGAFIVEPWVSSIPALLYGWYSGCEGGHALADVLFGRADAAGRLPFSIPKSEADLPEFQAAATKVTYDRWFGQRLIDRKGVEASFPLGFGLSYTTFSFSDAVISPDSIHSGNTFEVSVRVSNTGPRPGRHVVQVYGLPSPQQEDFPKRLLLGYAPLALEPSESKTITIQASKQPLMKWEDGRFVLVTTNALIEVASYSGDNRALQLQCQLE